MSVIHLQRVLAAASASTVLAGAVLAGATAPAAASTGGGCNGPVTGQACVGVVEADGGAGIVFEVRADLGVRAGSACRLRLLALDETTGVRWDSALVPCDRRQRQERILPNPTEGHVYRAELQILPNGKNLDSAESVLSPALSF
ncbi:hypothetical protein [Streptomyces yangpuensis]|uniref:hypothetical protein n=1 Tax=Streptomyces yangpuensis TaxID=1648182 RepID=UPI003660CBB6